MISLAFKISHCLSANHNPELRCVICTGVTLFALVLRLNCTALSQSESSNFFMCSINPKSVQFHQWKKVRLKMIDSSYTGLGQTKWHTNTTLDKD